LNIEKEFYSDVKNKKRISSGIHSRTGKRGYVGKILFTYDLMNPKERREYMKPSKVEVYNMFDTIIPYNDFKLMDRETRIKYLSEYTKRFTQKEIADAWGVKPDTVYNYFYRYKIPVVKKAHGGGPRKRVATITKETKPAETVSVVNTVTERPKIMVELGEGFSVQLNGEFDAEVLQKRLEKLAFLLEEGKKYSIKLVLNELEDKDEKSSTPSISDIINRNDI
jgi:DNA-binding CsgD family transcriptional regulator